MPPAGRPSAVAQDFDLRAAAAKAVDESRQAIEEFDLSTSIAAALSLIRTIDAYINASEPFKVAKDPARRDELATILYECIEAVRIASLLLWPAMPAKMQELWSALNLRIQPGKDRLADLAQWGGMNPGTKVVKVALFPRVEQAPAAAPQTANA